MHEIISLFFLFFFFCIYLTFQTPLFKVVSNSYIADVGVSGSSKSHLNMWSARAPRWIAETYYYVIWKHVALRNFCLFICGWGWSCERRETGKILLDIVFLSFFLSFLKNMGNIMSKTSHIHKNILLHMYSMHKYLFIYICGPGMHPHTCACTHPSTRMHIYTYIYMYILIYICVCVCGGGV